MKLLSNEFTPMKRGMRDAYLISLDFYCHVVLHQIFRIGWADGFP